MEERKMGRQGPSVSAIGLGCMSLGIADVYSSSLRDEGDAVGLIRQALELGVTLLDTANIYGDSEIKVGKALKGRREGVVVATKFGIATDAIGASSERADGRPEYVRSCCEASLKRLGIEQIDVYYQHRIDPNVPIEETVGAMAELVKQGKVRYLGLSEASPATVRRAHRVHPIAAVQTEYSLFSRDPEEELLPTLRELGIGLVAYSPLGRGFLAGRFKTIDDLDANDWRRGSPRFQGDNFAKNLRLVDKINAIAANKRCTASQLALAWLLARGNDIVPIPGTSSARRLAENVAATTVRLDASDMEDIEAVTPLGAAAGARYHEAALRLVNH
jgi:aryl-alcohol dehydrogenase-like predicted oxidoreductase